MTPSETLGAGPPAPPLRTRVVRASRWKAAGVLLLAILFGWWTSGVGGAAGWLLFSMLLPVIVIATLALLEPPSIVLDEAGFTVRPVLYKQSRVLWTDVEGPFSALRQSSGRTVSFSYKPDRRPSFWDSAVIPPYLEISPQELTDLLNDYRARAIEAAPSTDPASA